MGSGLGFAAPGSTVSTPGTTSVSVNRADALHLAHLDHARYRLDGAGHLRRNMEPARQAKLDLAPSLVELQDDRHLPIALLPQAPSHRIEGLLALQEDADAALSLGHGVV